MSRPRPHVLSPTPDLPRDLLARVREDHNRFAEEGLPTNVEDHLRERYGLDVAAVYAGLPIRNPWGKASGQLTMRTGQVEDAARAGLGFVVLKTVIAQDASGGQSMAAWAIKESRMDVERIVGRESGETGWTVTWKGRGWWQTFADYLDFTREAVGVGRTRGMVVAPSVKYHLPGPDETTWRTEEYLTTTRAILDAYRAGGGVGPMPLEKDFSPTLAGAERSRQRRMILEWLEKVPVLIRGSVEPGALHVGMKLFNSLEDDEFQLDMLRAVHTGERADFLVYANRLFDSERVFDGQKGVAYGGPDLSDRNLRLLTRLRREPIAEPLEVSATGDVLTGKTAVEYLLRGCTSFQMHTLFQLPAEEFAMRRGDRIERALHRLYFDPASGLVVWLAHAGRRLGLDEGGIVRLMDVAAAGRSRALEPVDLDAG